MGAGVAKALMQKWPVIRNEYIKWHKRDKDFKLGNIQTIKVEKDIAVVNMIGQRHIKPLNGVPPIRYKAIEQCLLKVSNLAEKYGASIHAPKFGAGLAGGKWENIENMLQDLVCSRDIPVTIYLWENE
jgi:O-acetyl-ADP-ribose deacetylase (regulator of RNase III)